MDKETIQSVSEASSEVARASGKALDLTASVGRFIHKIIGEPVEELVGTVVTDPIKEYRKRRLHALQQKTEAIVSERKVTETRAVPPSTAVPLLEAASLESDDDVLGIWARLLAHGLDPKRNEISKRQIKVLSELSAQSAKLVVVLGEIFEESEQSNPDVSRKKLLRAKIHDEEVEHLVALGVLKYKMVSAGQAEGADYNDGEMVYVDLPFSLPDPSKLVLTSFGQQLFEAIRS